MRSDNYNGRFQDTDPQGNFAEDFGYEQRSAQVETIGAAVPVANQLLSVNTTPESVMHDRVIATLEARVLATDHRDVTARASVSKDYYVVRGVWNSIVVFWLLRFLLFVEPYFASYSLLHRGVHHAQHWAADHFTARQVTAEKTVTERVPQRMCPHVRIPDNETHLRWLASEGSYGPGVVEILVSDLHGIYRKWGDPMGPPIELMKALRDYEREYRIDYPSEVREEPEPTQDGPNPGYLWHLFMGRDPDSYFEGR